MLKKVSIPALTAMAIIIAGPVHAGSSVSGVAPNAINYNNAKQVQAAINKQRAQIKELRAQVQTNQDTMARMDKKLEAAHDIFPDHGKSPDKYVDGPQWTPPPGGAIARYDTQGVPSMKDKKAQITAQNMLIFELSTKVANQKIRIDGRRKHYDNLSKDAKKEGINLGSINSYTVAQLNAMAAKKPGNGFPPVEEYKPPFNAHGPLPVDDELPFNAHGPLPINDDDGADHDAGHEGGSGDSDEGRPGHGDGDNDGGNSPDHEGQELLGGDGHDMEDMGHGKGDDDMGHGKEPMGGGGSHKVPTPPVLGLLGMAIFAVARRRKKHAA